MRTASEIEDEKPDQLQLDQEVPENLETATFSMGCFWGPEALFGGIEGVYRTRAGYTGGEKETPTYQSLGDHTETVQIDYNPKEISYEELLDIFWENHNPTKKRKKQYASRIFYHTERQMELARESLERYKEENGKAYTQVLPVETFWVAEDYHQKYYLRQRPSITEKLEEIYSPEEFIHSTFAARLNAVVAGKLSLSNLEHKQEIDLSILK